MTLPTSDGGAIAGIVAASFPWTELWIAIAGGLVATLLGGLFRVGRIGAEISEHDRRAAEINENLRTWVIDDTIRLRRQLHTLRERLNKRGLFFSGTYGRVLGEAKEAALQGYRDQERSAMREVAALRGSENWMHAVWRSLRRKRAGLDLTAPKDVKELLDGWAAPVKRHSPSAPRTFVDPRERTIEGTIAEIEGDPLD